MGKRKIPEIPDDHPMFAGGPSFEEVQEDSRTSEEQEGWRKYKETKKKAKAARCKPKDKEELTQSLGDLLRTQEQ